ncbi:hypothetical protein HYH03_010360 [Edaphochlamys debaryana]|uniref:Uncharacterized protein n=1 Tax=Edaphochlamys debaryana TaxID=47281 RepID=A0A835XZM8_9CHLO|nr:hypothetical protein HYH03_010360 [Edaphochlamys debaryana]|eukprot:KAG2491361.1 hypothetical protein HYH03_010360 [Edaphochlamys debaryana]
MQSQVVLIATGSADGSIAACDLQSGTHITSYKGCGCPRKGLCTLGQGYLAAAQAHKQAIHFWTWHREQVLQRSFVSESILAVAASPDGAFLAGGGASGTLYLWEAGSGRLLRTWAGHYKSVSVLLFVGGNSVLLSGGQDTVLSAWLLPELLDPAADPSSPAFVRPTPLHAWSDHTLPLTALAAGAGEAAALVASGSADRTVKLRRLSDGRLLMGAALPAAVNDVAMDAGEQWLFAAGADGCVYQVPLAPEPLGPGAGPSSAAFGSSAAAASASATEGAAFRTLRGHTGPVSCLALAPSGGPGGGEVLVSGSEDGTVRAWDLASSQPLRIIPSPGKAAVTALLVLPRPPYMAAAGGGRGGETAGALGAEPAGAGGGGGGSGKGGPKRPQPLAPLAKYLASGAAAGAAGSGTASWEGPPVVLDGSEAGAPSCTSLFLGMGAAAGGVAGPSGAGIGAGAAATGLPPGLAALVPGVGPLGLLGGAGEGGSGAGTGGRSWEAVLG